VFLKDRKNIVAVVSQVPRMERVRVAKDHVNVDSQLNAHNEQVLTH